jgi:hypothetical protein
MTLRIIYYRVRTILILRWEIENTKNESRIPSSVKYVVQPTSSKYL